MIKNLLNWRCDLIVLIIKKILKLEKSSNSVHWTDDT